MKKLLSLMLCLLLLLTALPALAEDAPEPLLLADYVAAMNAMAEKADSTLTWLTEPFNGLEDYTLCVCQTLQGSPALVCYGDRVAMIGSAVTFDPALAPLGPESYLGQYLVAMMPILTSRGMTEDEAFEALMPLTNEENLLERVAQTSLDGTPCVFNVAGYQAAILRYDGDEMPQLCLYIYAAPELLPR